MVVVFFAAATWIGIAVFLRLNNGWYGAGWGAWGIELNVFIACLAVLATAIGPAIRSAFRLAKAAGVAGQLAEGRLRAS